MSEPTDGRTIFNAIVDDDTVEFAGMPEGKTVLIQVTGGPVTVAFYDDNLEDFGSGEEVEAPGGRLDCPHERVQFTTAAEVGIRVVPFKG
jgi:hypothetical protein